MNSFTGCLLPGWNPEDGASTSIGLSLTSLPDDLSEAMISGVSRSTYSCLAATDREAAPEFVILTFTLLDSLRSRRPRLRRSAASSLDSGARLASSSPPLASRRIELSLCAPPAFVSLTVGPDGPEEIDIHPEDDALPMAAEKCWSDLKAFFRSCMGTAPLPFSSRSISNSSAGSSFEVLSVKLEDSSTVTSPFDASQLRDRLTWSGPSPDEA